MMGTRDAREIGGDSQLVMADLSAGLLGGGFLQLPYESQQATLGMFVIWDD